MPVWTYITHNKTSLERRLDEYVNTAEKSLLLILIRRLDSAVSPVLKGIKMNNIDKNLIILIINDLRPHPSYLLSYPQWFRLKKRYLKRIIKYVLLCLGLRKLWKNVKYCETENNEKQHEQYSKSNGKQ